MLHAEPPLTCARPQVYSTATHGLPELDVIAAGANGKPVWDSKKSLRNQLITYRRLKKNIQPYQKGDPVREHAGYEMLQS